MSDGEVHPSSVNDSDESQSGRRANPSTEDPANPTDTSMLSVVHNLERDGYHGQFRCLVGALVECLTCRETSAADEIVADEVTRLEGASDPADMVMIIPLHCPRCGTPGMLVLPYGPDGGEAAEAEVMVAFDRRPQEGASSGPATPGIGTGFTPTDPRR